MTNLQPIQLFTPRQHGLHLLIFTTYILGAGMVHESPLKKEIYGGVIRYPLFSYEHVTLKGLFFTKVHLGNPPQKLNVLVDTGSDPFWVNCHSSKIPATERSYDMNLSTTASVQVPCPNEKNPCPFYVKNTDKSSVSGFMVNDTSHLEADLGNTSTSQLTSRITFGCTTTRTLMKSAIEGILGLGLGKKAFVAQLAAQHIAPKVFSLCLASQGNGFLILGQVSDTGFVYTPIVSSSAYTVAYESITVNGKQLTINPQAFEHGILIDSGAQTSVLVAEAYDTLVHAISEYLNQASFLGPFDAQCYLVSASEVFPTVQFQFRGGAVLNLRPTYYLFQTIFEGLGGWCINFRRENNVTILGTSSMGDKIVIYDLIHSQIGWLDSDCSKPVQVRLDYDSVGDEAERCTWSMSLLAIAVVVHFISAV